MKMNALLPQVCEVLPAAKESPIRLEWVLEQV